MIGVNKSGVGQFGDISTKNTRRSKTSARGLFAVRNMLLLIFVIIALLSLIAALFVLVLQMFNRMPGFLGSGVNGGLELNLLPFAAGWAVVFAVVLGLNGLLFAFLARLQVVHNQLMYVDAGCPHCYELKLMRIHRRKRDRWLRITGLPVWRYACQFCTWQGLRLKDDDHTGYGNAIVEAEVEKVYFEALVSGPSVSSANGDLATKPFLAVEFAVDPAVKQEAPDADGSGVESKDNEIDFARLCLEVVRSKK